MRSYCIAFAGVPGSSKTPIAYYLSEQLGLPIFNSDAIRTEVKEDKGWFDIPEFDRRRETRLRAMLAHKRPFIHDSSLDRQWDAFQSELGKADYSILLISIDLSRQFLERLYAAKAYDMSEIDQYSIDHEQFLASHNQDAIVHITDTTFPNRLEIVATAVNQWLAKEGFTHG